MNGESTKPTPYAVTCPVHGRVYLTEEEYHRQMMKPDQVWACPRSCVEDVTRVDTLEPMERMVATLLGVPASRFRVPEYFDVSERMVGICGHPSWWDDEVYEAALMSESVTIH